MLSTSLMPEKRMGDVACRLWEACGMWFGPQKAETLNTKHSLLLMKPKIKRCFVVCGRFYDAGDQQLPCHGQACLWAVFVTVSNTYQRMILAKRGQIFYRTPRRSWSRSMD